MFSWGIDRDKTGILGLGENYFQPIPVLNNNFKDNKIMIISISEKHACAIDNRHHLSSWGTGLNGELGIKDITKTTVPIQVGLGSILPMSVQCGMGYTILITYESIPYYFGIIDNSNNKGNWNDNTNELRNSIDQLTHYNNYNSEERIKSIPFNSPYRINNVYCGEHMIALIDLMGNLYLYSEKEGLNRVRISMSVKSLKFVNNRIYALTKQSDYLYEFTSRGGDDNPLEDYIENMYTMHKDSHKIDIIDTPYFDKALFFSLECTNILKHKVETKEEKIFTLIKNPITLQEPLKTNMTHSRYNSSPTVNNTDSSRINIKSTNQSQSQCNIYYNSGNISSNPSILNSNSILSKQTAENRASMPDIKIKHNRNGNTRIGKISNLLGQIFDTKIDHIMNNTHNSSYLNVDYWFKGKKKIELERVYPGYCYTRDGLFTTENINQNSQKRAVSQTSRDVYDSNNKRKYMRSASQDRYMNTQEVHQILKRAKKEDEYIDSIRNDYDSNEKNNKDIGCDNHNTTLRRKITAKESTGITTLTKAKDQNDNKRNKSIKEKDSNYKEGFKIIDIISTMKKKEIEKEKITDYELSTNKVKIIRDQCKELPKHIKDDIIKVKGKHPLTSLTKMDNNVSLQKIIEAENTEKTKHISNRLTKTNNYCESIVEKNETDRSQLDNKYNLMTIKTDQPSPQLLLINQSQSITLQAITNLYLKTPTQNEKERQRDNKANKRSKSSAVIRKINEKDKEMLSNLKETKIIPQEQYPIMIYKKPIKSTNKMTKPNTVIQKDKPLKEINQPLFVSEKETNFSLSKTTTLKLMSETKKEDDSELNEALFSSDDATNNISTKRHSQNELSGNNMIKRTHSNISSKRDINKQSQNTLHIEHIDLNYIINEETKTNLNNEEEINSSNNANRSNPYRNIKSSSLSPSSIIQSPTTPIQNTIYQSLILKNNPNDNIKDDHIKESNSSLKGIEYSMVKNSNSLFKRSSSMASIHPNTTTSFIKTTALSPIIDSNQRNTKKSDDENSKIDKDTFSSTNYHSHNKPSLQQTKDKSIKCNDRNNNISTTTNNNCYDILTQDKNCFSINKYHYVTNVNTPVRLINIQQVKDRNNTSNGITFNKVNKKTIDKRPSFASSKPKIIEKVKTGQITKNHSKGLLSKTSRGSSSTIKHNNKGNHTYETKDTSILHRQKSLGNISPNYHTMTLDKRPIQSEHLSNQRNSHSSVKKIILNRTDINKNPYSIEQLRDKYIKYFERLYDNDKNKIISQLLSPKGSDNDFIRDFFNNEMINHNNGFINPSEVMITYQDFHEDLKKYIINNLDNLKLVQVKEQIENNNHTNSENPYIPEVTKTVSNMIC